MRDTAHLEVDDDSLDDEIVQSLFQVRFYGFPLFTQVLGQGVRIEGLCKTAGA